MVPLHPPYCRSSKAYPRVNLWWFWCCCCWWRPPPLLLLLLVDVVGPLPLLTTELLLFRVIVWNPVCGCGKRDGDGCHCTTCGGGGGGINAVIDGVLTACPCILRKLTSSVDLFNAIPEWYIGSLELERKKRTLKLGFYYVWCAWKYRRSKRICCFINHGMSFWVTRFFGTLIILRGADEGVRKRIDCFAFPFAKLWGLLRFCLLMEYA